MALIRWYYNFFSPNTQTKSREREIWVRFVVVLALLISAPRAVLRPVVHVIVCCFRFLVSVCYSKAKVAAACAGIMYFLSYVPYMYVAIREEAAGDNIPAWVKSCVVRARLYIHVCTHINVIHRYTLHFHWCSFIRFKEGHRPEELTS